MGKSYINKKIFYLFIVIILFASESFATTRETPVSVQEIQTKAQAVLEKIQTDASFYEKPCCTDLSTNTPYNFKFLLDALNPQSTITSHLLNSNAFVSLSGQNYQLYNNYFNVLYSQEFLSIINETLERYLNDELKNYDDIVPIIENELFLFEKGGVLSAPYVRRSLALLENINPATSECLKIYFFCVAAPFILPEAPFLFFVCKFFSGEPSVICFLSVIEFSTAMLMLPLVSPVVFIECIVDPDFDLIISPLDNCPSKWNSDQKDSDGDGIGDVCDTDCDDNDGDGHCAAFDNCPTNWNPNQEDCDGDGVGDKCDIEPDGDHDGVADACDNCPTQKNSDQKDCDKNAIGDECDIASRCADSDHDTILNPYDNCPLQWNRDQEDCDGNGIGDWCDPDCHDSDRDMLCAACDNCPNNYNPDQSDSDGDGIGDACDN